MIAVGCCGQTRSRPGCPLPMAKNRHCGRTGVDPGTTLSMEQPAQSSVRARNAPILTEIREEVRASCSALVAASRYLKAEGVRHIGRRRDPTRCPQFCGKCGTALPRDCSRCGQVVPAEDSFCSECGASVVAGGITPAPSSIRRAPTTATGAAAERRQLTIMFCEMVGSSAPAGKAEIPGNPYPS